MIPSAYLARLGPLLALVGTACEPVRYGFDGSEPSADEPITGSLVASRTSGVAPLAVFFDASGTTSTDTSRPFHDLEYRWGFDDPSSGTWTSSGASRNSARGPVA